MANRTNASEYFWSYEYYWDYIDPIPVDGRKLKVNKYTIVIAFWVGLAAFVMFLFLILLYMSRSGSTPIKQVFARRQAEESSSNGEQPHCDDHSSPDSDLIAPETPNALSGQTGIHGSISA
ncbi:melanocortin-2 receptor accessory protein [Nothoprocta perdicaria]|uniref:melanocortin-2 receptor accessory protein n=1 Tax=Nothoprocta perdicaria TaxID=30464 RepID=UPI000E1BFD10|nr:melanocortin-2 receptor accessory protein [Nothoprocta perdicaria]